ncbi:hypothetical protein PbDSM24746_21000 [Paenibacillus macerans]|nr:hypothetical protein PbDSM24746_21000 [Paenibacillus macerans]GBK68404.1 hypothetical protein PbJCM17693_21120 [Paenibacillus macerans]GIP10480.1 hypothetical protein J1TS5_26500 [Paenibacillus macerans]
MDNSEGDYKQQLINVANQVSSVGSSVSSGSYQISNSIKELESSLGVTNLLLFILIISIGLNTFMKWKSTKKN